MDIISKNEKRAFPYYVSTQFRFSLLYVAITCVVLLFLNYYCSRTSQKLFYQSKEASMLEKCLLTASEISQLEVLNASTVSNAVSQMEDLISVSDQEPVSQLEAPKVTRLVITDQSASAIYDSAGDSRNGPSYLLFPEIVKALEGNDVFTWRYHDGQMYSRCATPIFSYGALVGCVYIMEYDIQQGQLVRSLQNNILTVTFILELAVILFSFVFSSAFSARVRQIMASMRIIREGDYSHRVVMGGRDEMTVLGNEFNDLTDRLQTSERKRQQFVSNASHELKTPLASIKLLSDSILQNDMDMGTVREFVEDIGNEADRLNRMSQKLLSLSKIESQEDGECEIVYMAPTIQRVVRMLLVIAQESQITISMDLADDCPILILEDDLYQITFNLVENAIKYNTPGGKVFISLHREEDNGVLTVRDTGVGIPADSLAHIFERFYRVDKARSRKSGGSGLGLSIVRNMVERNGGHITTQSTLGVGTTFTVTFPAFDTEVDR